MATQTMSIPEIINGVWTKKHITVIVPDTCSLCNTKRGPVKNLKNPSYGSVRRANCPTLGCKEDYESLRKQFEAYKASGNKVIPASFFKPKMDAWKPDTRVGSVPVNARMGSQCSGYCNEWFDYAEPNQPNGKFVCRTCRNRC